MCRAVRTVLRLCGVVVALTGIGLSAVPAKAQLDAAIEVAAGDQDASAAVAKARATLPEFWKRLEAPQEGEDGFALRVAIPVTPEHTEYIWVGSISRGKDGRLRGRYANLLRGATGKGAAAKTAGGTLTFSDAQVADWMFLRNGKIVGGETLRPLLQRLPREKADELRARFETP